MPDDLGAQVEPPSTPSGLGLPLLQIKEEADDVIGTSRERRKRGLAA